MILSDFFTELSYGELSNTALAVDGTGTIEEAHQPKVVRYINEGLKRLHGRFPLIQKDVLVELRSHITNYHLIPRFAESNWVPDEVEFPYIKDLIKEPFTGDVARILEVRNSLGHKLELNDPENAFSVFTPQVDVLQVPRPVTGVALSVLYQAYHPTIYHHDLEAEIVLPNVLSSALSAYVAYNVFSHMNTQEATSKAQEHMAKYESICVEVETQDLVNSSSSQTNSRFAKRGWV